MAFWLRIIVYLGVCLGIVFCCYIPMFLLFPELIGNNYPNLMNDQRYLITSQVATALGISIGTYLMIVKIENRRLTEYLLNVNIISLLKGFLLGIVLMSLFSSLMIVVGWIQFNFNIFSFHLVTSFILYFFVAVAEEILARGYILNNLRHRFNAPVALVVSSVIFGAMHVGNDYFTWIGFANISLSGFLMGLVALKSKSVSAAIGLHWSWNFFQGPVFGFAVSGHQELGILKTNFGADKIFTGGNFGAEGSIILTSISIVFIGLVYRYYENSPNSNLKELA